MRELKHKVGDTVVITGNSRGHEYEVGDLVDIINIINEGLVDARYLGTGQQGQGKWAFGDDECALFEPPVSNKTSSGGPSKYYDQPYATWVTTNDQMEYLAENKWGKYAIHLKDIFKGLCRWGDKEGTTVEYDSRKIIYYGCRVLKMIVGTRGLREYLQELLDDEQFQGEPVVSAPLFDQRGEWDYRTKPKEITNDCIRYY